MFVSYAAEENFGKILDAVYRESGGKIRVNLDVTNNARGGLFKYAEYGSNFLENRYCCHKWPFHLYSPEHVLKTAWELSHYCNLQDIQLEIPSPEDLLEEAYSERNLPLPTRYPLQYWAMLTFFASPLLWLSPSTLSESLRKELGEIMRIQRKYRDFWRQSIIYPVGSRPDGASISGLYAESGWLLVFREINAQASTRLSLPPFEKAECIYSIGAAVLEADGTISMESPASAALFRIQK